MAWKSAIKAVPLAHLDAPYSYGGMGYPEHTGAFPFPSPLGDGVTSLFLAEVMFKLAAGTICWRPEGRFKQTCKVHPYPAVFLWHPTTRPYFLSKRGKYQEISLQRQHWEKGTHSELQHPQLPQSCCAQVPCEQRDESHGDLRGAGAPPKHSGWPQGNEQN